MARTSPGDGRVLPGFRLTLLFSCVYLSAIVVLPLLALAWRAAELRWDTIVATLQDDRVVAAIRLSCLLAMLASLANVCLGLWVAWVLERYRFFGRRFLDALIDLPFVMPTAVAGIALTALYCERGWLGGPLARLGVRVAFTPLGMVVALVFIGLPLVVRAVQPVLKDLDPAVEEAAWMLGASRPQIFRYVLLPEIWPSLATGFALSFARCMGEYGSLVFISGNLPHRTEIAPLLIVTKLEQFDYHGAICIAGVLLTISIMVLLLMNHLERRRQRRLADTCH